LLAPMYQRPLHRSNAILIYKIVHRTPYLNFSLEKFLGFPEGFCSVQVEELRAQCGDFLETITVSSPNFYTSILSQLVKLVLLLFPVRFLVVP
jgi:hypothetical protein